jgi:predicted nuclease of predicted toxin-antitoxin system
MRLLADENFPGDAVSALIDAGYDLVWVRTANPGMADPDVLAWAQAEERVVLTFDKDFGELAFRVGLPSACGIILFRISAPSSDYVARTATAVLRSRSDWVGHFSVIDDKRIRMIPLLT